MDFKGTKGKWQMTTSALECDHNTEVATIWGDSEYGEGATLIAHIDKGAGNEKAIANAQLIAAAPELLEALTKCKDVLQDNLKAWQYKNEKAMLEAYKQAEETINKALGKEGEK